MPDFGALHGGGIVLGATSSATVTAAGVPYTKGSYTQIIASTDVGACGLIVQFRNTAGSTRCSTLSDIAVGGGGSEQIVIADLLHGLDYSGGSDLFAAPLFFPIPIPQGSRIAARLGCSTASLGQQIYVTAVAGAFVMPAVLGRVTSYGADTGAAQGTILLCPSSGDGTWAQLAASTTNAIRMLRLIVKPWIGNASGDLQARVDLGVGSPGSEQVIYSSTFLFRPPSLSIAEALGGASVSPLLPISIASGQRLAARLSFIGGLQSDMTAVVYGID